MVFGVLPATVSTNVKLLKKRGNQSINDNKATVKMSNHKIKSELAIQSSPYCRY